jgi:phosphoenolpyruvate-protein kinase (PTS system EI component)
MAEMTDMGLLGGAQDETRVGEYAPENEQRIYDAVVNSGMAMMYNKQMSDRFVEMMKSSSDLPATIAQIVNMLGEAIKKRAKRDISHDILFHAAGELIDLLLEMAEKAGIQTDEQTAEMAFYKTVEMFAEMSGGMNDQEMQQLKQDFEELPPEAIRDVEMRFMQKTPIAEGVQNAMGA